MLFFNSYYSKQKSKNIFFAGDYKLGATTLINAIGDAKKTAIDVDKYLMKRDVLSERYTLESTNSTKRTLKDNYIPLTDMRLKDLPKRTFTAEVELVSDTGSRGGANDVTNGTSFLIKDVTIPAGSSLEILSGGKVVLETTDELKKYTNLFYL